MCMLEKFRSFNFLVLFSVFSTFSANAGLYDTEEGRQVVAFCRHFKLEDSMAYNVYERIEEGRARDLNEFEVPNMVFITAHRLFLYYRHEEYFPLLTFLFSIMPKDKREKAFSFLNMNNAYKSIGPSLSEFKGLKDKLLNLPYKKDYVLPILEK